MYQRGHLKSAIECEFGGLLGEAKQMRTTRTLDGLDENLERSVLLRLWGRDFIV